MTNEELILQRLDAIEAKINPIVNQTNKWGELADDLVPLQQQAVNLFIEHLKIEQFARLPVIVITAHAHDELGSDDIKDFNAFASGMRPRYMMEKPITPEKLVKAISEILEAEVDTAQINDGDRMEVIKIIGNTDVGTLKKIQSLLAK
jgi:two-component SAPR family response regulator